MDLGGELLLLARVAAPLGRRLRCRVLAAGQLVLPSLVLVSRGLVHLHRLVLLLVQPAHPAVRQQVLQLASDPGCSS